ncbi:MAG: GNAT family N-acetyltransferase [Anaerolineae bacterium]|nr:GNAT family N-acetyltransferase [Anaerolineae bacterium]
MSITYRILETGDEAALEAFVLPRIASSMFLLGNMRMSGLTDNGKPYTGTYAAAFDEDEIVGAVAHFWNGNLIVQSPLAYLAKLWQTAVSTGSVQSVSASNRPLQGIIGPSAQVEFILKFLEIEQDFIQVDDVENLYSLALADLVVPDGLRNGRLQSRRAELEDIDLLIQWRVEFNIEGLNETDSPELRKQAQQSVERVVAEGRMWLLLDNDVPVSTTAFNTAAAEAVQVGGVYTPPAYRSKGYARAAVAASLLDARNEGVQTGILFTGIHNYPAQKAYTALGFNHIGDYRILLLKRPFIFQ